MSEPRFTPGPWLPTATPGGWNGVMEPGGMLICSLNFNNPENASLIAAAPELYAGLLELLGAIESELIASASNHTGTDDADFLEEFPEDYERCKRLRSLLAKARGETP